MKQVAPRLMFSRHLVAGILLLVILGCAGSREPTSRAELENEFESEFGFRPSTEVIELRCRIVRVGDGVGEWLSFKCDEPTFNMIVGHEFVVVSPDAIDAPELPPFDIENRNPNAPKWWPKDFRNAKKVYYLRRPYEEGKRRESMYLYLWKDEATQIVYSHSVAWH